MLPAHYLETDFYKDRLVELEGGDWMEIPHDDNKIFQDEKNILTCQLGPGDMLLWDSRTVHCSYPGHSNVEADSDLVDYNDLRAAANGLIRAATLVSMMPCDL
jgi:hypothetical protein